MRFAGRRPSFWRRAFTSEASLLPVGRVRVGHVGRERAFGGVDDQGTPVLHRRLEVKLGAREGDRPVDLLRQRAGILAGEVPADPPIDDLPVLLGGEVHPIGEVPIPEVHTGAQRFQRPPARVLLARVVPEDGEHGDVRLRGHVLADGVDQPEGSPPGQAIEHGRPRGFQWGPAVELRDRVVAQSISGWAMTSRMFPALTLPPYWTLAD